MREDSALWPDWGDCGRVIEGTLANGETVTAPLYAYDEFWTGEDEVPLLSVGGVSLCDFVEWGYVE